MLKNIFNPEVIKYFKNNKDQITPELLDELRKTKEGKSIAFEILDLEKNDEGFYLDAFGKEISYKRISTLKNVNRKLPLHPIHIEEIKKCKEDIFYFMHNYVKIKTPKGVDYPDLRYYQIDFLNHILPDEHESIVALLPRQAGKSITVSIYLCWLAVFEKDVNIGIAAQVKEMAKEFLKKVKDIFIELPIWLTPGVKTWNKTSVELENGVRLLADTASSNAFRGYTINYSVTDEAAYISGQDNGMSRFQAYLDSMLPSQSSLVKKKNIFISTANGMNDFYYLYKGALEDGFEEVEEILDKNDVIYSDTIENHYKSDSIFKPKEILNIEPLDNQKYKVKYLKRKPGKNGSLAFNTDWRRVPRWNPDGTVKTPEQFREEVINSKGEVFFNQAYANCVGYDTIINIDGKDIKIGDLYNSIESKKYLTFDVSENKNIKQIYKEIKNKRVLTPYGFKSFNGILKSYKNTLKIVFDTCDSLDFDTCDNLKSSISNNLKSSISNNLKSSISNTSNISNTPNMSNNKTYKEIIVAEKHIFVIDNQEIFAKDLKPGDKLQTENGYYTIKKIEKNGLKDVYDLVNVEYELYYTNNIISHNTFIGSSYTLISADILKTLKAKEPIDVIDGKLKVYKKFQKGHHYLCTVDPAKDGVDRFVVNFVDITSLKFEQVATAILDIDYLLMPELLNEWCKYYGNPYLIIENNEGAGQSVADQMVNTYEYYNIHYDKNQNVKNSVRARKKYPGFRTTARTRNLILKTMKTFLENGNLIINDKETIKELHTFILIDGKYQADQGAHDDCVMSLALAFALFTDIKNFSDMKKVVEQLKQDKENKDPVNVAELITVGEFDDGVEDSGVKTDSRGFVLEGFDDSPDFIIPDSF